MLHNFVAVRFKDQYSLTNNTENKNMGEEAQVKIVVAYVIFEKFSTLIQLK